HRNLSSILAHRLTETTRRVLDQHRGRVAVLLDEGAPPLLGYALACSVAWHTRKPTLLLIATDGAPPHELGTLARSVPSPGQPGFRDCPGAPRSTPANAGGASEARAELSFVRWGDGDAAERLAGTVEE